MCWMFSEVFSNLYDSMMGRIRYGQEGGGEHLEMSLIFATHKY